MAITEGEWLAVDSIDGSPVVAVVVVEPMTDVRYLPATLGDAELMAAAPELARTLRQLHDLAVVDQHHRYHEESRAAFHAAAELLKRLGF